MTAVAAPPATSGIVADLLALPPLDRRAVLRTFTADDLRLVLADAEAALGTWHGLWIDDPSGWCVDVLRGYVWSKQQEIGDSVVANRRTCVVASHATGKSFYAGELVAWWMSVHRPGTAQCVSTAPTFRQVRNVLWPHIHRAHRAHDLVGRLNRVEWIIDDIVLAWGFSPKDEAGAQGVHAEHLLIVVDEAGGIATSLGQNLDSLMTGDATRILAIGNPPTDVDGAWFETIAASPVWHTIRVSAFDTPGQTGEPCPPEVLRNLVSADWIADIEAQYGTDDPYYVARVLAEFPKSASRRAVPRAWADRVHIVPGTADEESLADDPDWSTTGWQRIGVDVAAGGGDEMVVAQLDGWAARIVDTWSGADAIDQTVNADRVLDVILAAEATQARYGYTANKVRVKIDANGIGAGTADILDRYGREGRHNSEIVRVIGQERASDAARYYNRRAEAWFTVRDVVRSQTIRLVVDDATVKQLTTPLYTDHKHGGRIAIETKDEMKKRGFTSPDRADAVVLAVYEPVPVAAATVSSSQQRRTLPRRPRRRA